MWLSKRGLVSALATDGTGLLVVLHVSGPRLSPDHSARVPSFVTCRLQSQYPEVSSRDGEGHCGRTMAGTLSSKDAAKVTSSDAVVSCHKARFVEWDLLRLTSRVSAHPCRLTHGEGRVPRLTHRAKARQSSAFLKRALAPELPSSGSLVSPKPGAVTRRRGSGSLALAAPV